MPKQTLSQQAAAHARRIAQHDREIAAIRKLILQGMKMIVANEKGIKELRVAQRETGRMIKALAAEQRALIRPLGRGSAPNGHAKGNIQ